MTTTRHQVTIRWGVKPTDGAVVYVGGRVVAIRDAIPAAGSRIVVFHHVKAERTAGIEPATGSAGLEPLIKKRRVSPAPKAVALRTFRQRCWLLAPFISSRCS